MGNYRDNLFFTPLIASGFVMLVSAADVLADDETTVTTMYGMMKEKGYRCLECHDVEVKVVGPSWKEVSARRKGNPWATALIRYKLSEETAGRFGVKATSSGTYGEAIMPHHEVSDADAQRIAQWILGLDQPKVPLVVKQK